MTGLRGPLTLALALTAAVVLASCSQTDGPVVALTTGAAPGAAAGPATSTATSSPTSHAPSTSASRRIDITVTGKQVTPTPALINIAVGESLTIAVTSDRDDELHAHGFNIEKRIKAGQRLEITVKGAQPGVYDIELHQVDLRILQVAVR